MHISERDGIFTVQHVTGPTHNTLKLKLRRGGDEAFSVTVLPPVGECRHHEGLTADEVVPEIRAGVRRANAALGTDLTVEWPAIIENDTRTRAVYDYLARRIVEKAAQAGRRSDLD